MKPQVLDFKQVYIRTLQKKANVPGGLAFEEKINPRWFNFSMDSLYYIDSYLLSVYVAREELDEKQVENTIWAIGFYVGEVIKRNADKGYQWKNWENFFPYQDTQLQDTYFQTMGTSAVLVAEDHSFILPINRVIQFFKEGPENSLHFFASQEIEPANV
jgi:hypothetical protein